MAHKCTGWLCNPCTVGVPKSLGWETKSVVVHKWGGWLHNACYLKGNQRFTPRDKTTSGPQMLGGSISPAAKGVRKASHKKEEPGGRVAT